MEADAFTAANRLALVGWLLLIFVPRWRWSARIIAPVALPAALAVVYLLCIATGMWQSRMGPESFATLAGVKALFTSDRFLLAGWLHYLAFDLFIGCWEVRDAQRHGVSHWLVVPCLLLTFLFGPVGMLLYFILRAASRRRLAVDEVPNAAPG